MDMTATFVGEPKSNRFSLSGTCPHCSHKAVFSMVSAPHLPPAEVRKIVGDRLYIGYSTHNEEQFVIGNREPVDYLALGPVFATVSKYNLNPVVGVNELARLRRLSSKPLVAIGGITRMSAVKAFEAGANSVAIISDFLVGDWRQSIAEWAELRP